MPSRRSNPEAEATALLRNPHRARAPQLLQLIHDLNPTGRDLPADEESRRYGLKSALQSLLLVHFRDELTVTAAAGGVVSLHHRPLDRDACHAIVADLEDEARSIVRLKLDLPEAPTAPTPSRPERPSATSPGDLLHQARSALDAYDYELARAHFTAALEATDGAVPESTAFLEFLVDQVAGYEDALAAEDLLSPAALRTPAVRALLSVCAAQLERDEAALGWLEGAEGERAVEAWVTLARTALKRGDPDTAERHLERARQLQTGHAGLVEALAELTRVRAAARAPLEEELQRLWAAGEEVEVERKARALPDSAVARRLLRELEARRRSVEAAGLCLRAEESFRAGAFDRAAALWTEAAQQGAEGLTPRIAEALRRDAERRSERRVAEVVAG